MQLLFGFMDASATAIHASLAQLVQVSATPDASNVPIDRLTSDLLNLAVIVVFVVLFLRTAGPTKRSRYLKHFAGVYALIGLFYLCSILLVQYKLILFVSARGGQQTQIDAVFADLDKIGELIKLIFSSLSSCFLLLTWYLLMHYPKEGISRGFYGKVFAVYTAGIPTILGFARMLNWNELKLLDAADSFFAFTGVLLVGFGLCRVISIQKDWSRPVRHIVTIPVVAAFLLWALPQLLFVPYRGALWFWLLLAGGKIAAGLAAFEVSVAILDPKPEFRSPGEASHAVAQ